MTPASISRLFDWRATALVVVAALLPGTDPSAATRPPTLDDLYREQTVSDPQISPDGAWIAYTLDTPNRESDSDESDIWLVSWDGKQSLQATSTAGSEHTPRFSPDGHYLSFLSDRNAADKGNQLWLIDRRGGEARQLTHVAGGITAYAWSPDGTRLVFTAEAPYEAGDGDKPAPIVIDRLQFKMDNQGYLGNAHSHLYLLDATSGAVTSLTEGRFDEIQPAWSPDGQQIAFLTKRGDDPDLHNNWDIFVMAATPGSVARQVTTSPGMEGDPTGEWGNGTPRFSLDGKRITYLAGGAIEDVWYGLVQVGVIDVGGGTPVLPTTPLDRNTVDPKWSTDGKWIYFRLEDTLSMVLARVRLSDGRVERLTPAGGVVTEFDVGARGRVVAVRGTISHPGELVAIEGDKLRTLSHHNDAWLGELSMVEAREIEFPSPDGWSVQALLLTPPGEAPVGGWPTIFRLHGGPVAQHQHEFDFTWQYLVSQGYAVVAPNPRGSSGRGYRYQKSLFADWGYADVPDILAGADYVVAKGIANPKRLGVGGWSYGSILTNYVIASDKRFKAATSGAGMSNMLAGYGHDHYVREWEAELGLPWVNTDLWLKLSYPFLHADRISTPTLFLGGASDANVPVIGAEQMYQALRRLGVPTRLVVYPGQYHGFDRPSLRADRLQRYGEWYDRFLKTP